ncbi:MAG: hypothetical protein WD872_20495 [Pirellulaceae bacterium]
MTLHNYRARTLSEALRLVRQELGPDASVLETREVGSTWSRWFSGPEIEVIASAEVRVPTRLPAALPTDEPWQPAADQLDFRRKFREDLRQVPGGDRSLVEQLCESRPAVRIPTCGPIRFSPGRTRTVALVGPTGVGKTTTIAKLAAGFQLQGQCRVGLITVDTYRIAAVEQLRTYAQILALPLEVVTTAHEMHAAAGRLADCDLILIDTAGRSPRDAQQLADLRALLAVAQPNEIHLVLSAVTAGGSLDAAAEAFVRVGASALVLTKLDEAAGVEWLPKFLERHRLPLSYTTHGQNVPDDIQAARAAPFQKLRVP